MASCNSIARVSSVFRKNMFKNRMAIVTGGATGIGKAITLELLHLGCKVVIASRNEDRLKEACQMMNSAFPSKSKLPSVTAIKCNIRQEDQVKELFEKSLSIYGQLDFVVNNGGGQFICPAADISLKGWNAVVETNLTGTFLMCREAYNKWMKANGGSIVNILMETRRGFAAFAHSAAARAGVGTLMKSLAIEWAQSGVRVNAVIPGSNIYSETAAANYGDPHIFHAQIQKVPAKRVGLPEEISGAVCFLLSPAASFITGESITVDGGQYLYSPQFWEIPDHNKLPAYDWKTDNNDDDQ